MAQLGETQRLKDSRKTSLEFSARNQMMDPMKKKKLGLEKWFLYAKAGPVQVLGKTKMGKSLGFAG